MHQVCILIYIHGLLTGLFAVLPSQTLLKQINIIRKTLFILWFITLPFRNKLNNAELSTALCETLLVTFPNYENSPFTTNISSYAHLDCVEYLLHSCFKSFSSNSQSFGSLDCCQQKFFVCSTEMFQKAIRFMQISGLLGVVVYIPSSKSQF